MEQADQKIVYSLVCKKKYSEPAQELSGVEYWDIARVKARILQHTEEVAKDKVQEIRSTLFRKTGFSAWGSSWGFGSPYNFQVKVFDDDLPYSFNPERKHTQYFVLYFSHTRYQIILWSQAENGDISPICSENKEALLEDFAKAWDQVPEQKLAIVEKKKLCSITLNSSPCFLDREFKTLEEVKEAIVANCPKSDVVNQTLKTEERDNKYVIWETIQSTDKPQSKNCYEVTFFDTVPSEEIPVPTQVGPEQQSKNNSPPASSAQVKLVQQNKNDSPSTSLWPKRIGFFLLNPFTYIAPAILIAAGLMTAWVQLGTPLFAEISMLTLGGALGLGAITTGIAILINFLSVFKEKTPIEKYLAERSKWSYISTAVGLAIFLTMLMVALTLFSDQIPFLDNIFNHLLQGMGVGMGEFAKLTDISFFASPEFLNPFSAVLKVIFVLTPAILIDGVGRIATAGEDYKYPDQFVSMPDGKKWDADNGPPTPGRKQNKSPVSQPGNQDTKVALPGEEISFPQNLDAGRHF